MPGYSAGSKDAHIRTRGEPTAAQASLVGENFCCTDTRCVKKAIRPQTIRSARHHCPATWHPGDRTSSLGLWQPAPPTWLHIEVSNMLETKSNGGFRPFSCRQISVGPYERCGRPLVTFSPTEDGDAHAVYDSEVIDHQFVRCSRNVPVSVTFAPQSRTRDKNRRSQPRARSR
jgi:hypothetical protein